MLYILVFLRVLVNLRVNISILFSVVIVIRGWYVWLLGDYIIKVSFFIEFFIFSVGEGVWKVYLLWLKFI